METVNERPPGFSPLGKSNENHRSTFEVNSRGRYLRIRRTIGRLCGEIGLCVEEGAEILDIFQRTRRHGEVNVRLLFSSSPGII